MRLGFLSALGALGALGAMSACAGDVSGSDTLCQLSISLAPGTTVPRNTVVTATAEVLGSLWGPLDWVISNRDTVLTRSGESISFEATEQGSYTVQLSSPACTGATLKLQVDDGVPLLGYQLRVSAPDGRVALLSYTDRFNQDAELELQARAERVSGQVEVAGVGAPAIVRIWPGNREDPVAELATGSDGTFEVLLEEAKHDVLVVPLGAEAPQRLEWTPVAGTTGKLRVAAGLPVSGRVLAPLGSALAGAKVALTIDGVPSTVATTAPDGSFALRARAGSKIEISVTPPAGSGLPRLALSDALVSLTTPLDVRYADTLEVRDLGGLAVTLDGAAAPGARVTVIGTMAAAGCIEPCASNKLAGFVRQAAFTNGAGVLASLRVPRGALHAVLEASSGEQAVHAVDTSAPAPSALAIAREPEISGSVTLAGEPLAEAVVRLEPLGPLEAAGVGVRQVQTAADGRFSSAAATGGQYRVVAADPRWRGIPVAEEVSAPAAIGAVSLRSRIVLRGQVTDGTRPIPHAAIELQCSSCVGLERQRPISATLADLTGAYQLALPKR